MSICVSLLVAGTSMGLVGCASMQSPVLETRVTAPSMVYAVAATDSKPKDIQFHSDFPGSIVPEQGVSDGRDHFNPSTLDARSLEWELLSEFQIRSEQVEFSDQHYVIPSHDWLEATFLPYALQYIRENGLAGAGEGRDCDNVSTAFRHLLVLSNAQSQGVTKGDVPCAILKTLQKNAFGGLAGDGLWHSLILIRTDRGWTVVEPQTGKLVPFREYPNRHEMSWALL